jgi:hypothetical protein
VLEKVQDFISGVETEISQFCALVVAEVRVPEEYAILSIVFRRKPLHRAERIKILCNDFNVRYFFHTGVALLLELLD